MPRYGSNPKAGLDPRTCAVCGSSFQPYRESQRACSRSCRDRLPDRQQVAREYRQRPEVRDRKNAARRVELNPQRREVNLRWQLRSLYGLSWEQYRDMLAAQGGKCALCGAVPNPEGVKAASRLHVDHDHETGKVRALLCNGCNRGLGYLGDDPARLRAAADYIEQHKE